MKYGQFKIKSKVDSGSAPRRLQRLCSIPKVCRSLAATILASFGLAQGASAATIGPGVAPITSPVTGFEIDGNLDAGASADWKSILDGTGAPLYPSVFHIPDGYSGVNDDVFSGSNKVNDDPGTYLAKVGSVPQKDDVNNALFFLGTDAAGDPWAGVAGDRLAVNGDSYMDFEFLQNTLTMNPGFTFTRAAALTSTGGRAIGDVLITLHFSNGGAQAEFFAQKWAQVGSAYRYVDFSPPATAFVSANIAGTVTAPYSVFGSSVPGTYVINQFGEAAINLRRLFEAAGEPCFTATTVFIRTKSSTAVTAELKDLIAPFQLTVTTKPLVEAGDDMTLCSAGATTQFALSGTVSSGSSPITSAAWSATTGPVVISNSAYNPVTGVVTALATVTGASANATVTLTASAQNGCVTSKPLALVVKSTPANPAADNNERCGTGDVALNATGTDLKWYSDANLQIQVGSGPSLNVAVPVGTSVIRYVTQTVDGCPSLATMVTATANTVPGAPSAQDNGRCDSGMVALNATGTDLKWYADSNLQTMVGSGSPLNVNVTAGSSVVRYVTQTVNGCESAPATVTASATTVPDAPSAQNGDRCDTGNVALTASGANLKWYSDANLQTQVGTGSPLNVNVIAGTSVLRYVTQTVAGCESAPTTATATAKTVPGVPSAQNADRCDSGNVALTAAGTDLKWYSDATLQIQVGTGSPLNVNVTAGSTVTRYVTQTVNGCESASTTVTATAKTVPGAPSAQNADRCDTGNLALTATGTDLKWYSDANLQSQVGTGSPLNVNVTAGTTVTRYVTQTVNGCESAPTTVTATAKTVPGAPSAQNAERCDTGNIALTATGTDLKWYSDANLQIQVGTGSPLNVNVTAGTTVTRYVTQTVDGCESAPTTVTAKANSIPGLPAVSPATRCGSGPVTLGATPGANGTVINWYAASVGGALFATGTSYTTPSLNDDAIYYVSTYNPTTTCESARVPVIATVTPATTGPASLGLYNSCAAASDEAVFSAADIGGQNVTYVWSLDIDGNGTRDFANLAGLAGVNIVNTAGNNNTVTSVLTLNVKSFNGGELPLGTHTVYLDITGDCGNLSPLATITIAQCDTFCTLTQGFYGNLKGKFLGVQGMVLVKNLLATKDLVVGAGDKSITITKDNVNCLVTKLPAGGPNAVLPSKTGGWNICDTTLAGGFSKDQLDKKGLKFRNNMLGQTITLGLNLMLANDKQTFLADYALGTGQICTAPATWDEETSRWVTDFNGCECRNGISANVIAALALYGQQNVQGLSDLANRALGGVGPLYGTTLDELHSAVGLINEIFDECRTSGCTPLQP